LPVAQQNVTVAVRCSPTKTNRMCLPNAAYSLGLTTPHADRCTMIDALPPFAQCLDCPYNVGAYNDGIWCAIASASTLLVDGISSGDQIKVGRLKAEDSGF